MRENEKKIILSLLNYLKETTGTQLNILSDPEKDKTHPCPCEAVIGNEDIQIILEHTLIQPYTGEKEDAVRFKQLMVPVESDLNKDSPFFLEISIPSKVITTDYVWKKITKEICAWARTNWSDWKPGEEITTPVGTVPFPVTFQPTRYATSGDRVFVMREVPQGLEKQREADVLRALQNKSDKLTRGLENADISLLLIESKHITLSNKHLIAKVSLKARDRFKGQLPNMIWLAETEREPFEHSPLKIGKEWYLESKLRWRDAWTSLMTTTQNRKKCG